MKRSGLMALLFLVWLPAVALEVQDFPEPRQEQRYRSLIDELRCLVCQNQNLADSNAELAQDLRQQVRTMISQGQSDDEIIDFMVARYGDFVLYRPPFRARTALLWLGPGLILLLGLVILVRFVRQRPTENSSVKDTELQRARQLLDSANHDRRP